MAGTLKGLAKGLREKADTVDTVGSRLAIAGASAALETLVYITPVDTSQALSNWQVFLRNPAPDQLPPYYPGSKGSTRGSSAREAIAEGRAELNRKLPGDTIYISNLVDYITKLDQGSSSQFPGGFVPRAVLAFRLAIGEAKKDIWAKGAA